MAKVEFYYKYSELDKQHEFAVVDGGCGVPYFLWVFFYMGAELQKQGCNKKSIYLLPYKPYHWNELKAVKVYKINGADKCGKLIADRIIKIIKT